MTASNFSTGTRIEVRSGEVNLVGDVWPAQGEHRGAVLLLHGGGQRRYSWHRTGEWLAESGWAAYAFDARGHGDSDWPDDGDYSVEAQVADMQAIIARIGESPVLVGASMGGITSTIGEGEIGGLARAVVLVDIVAHAEKAGTDRIRQFMSSAPNGFATLEEAADAISAYNPNRPRPKKLDGLRKNLVQGEDGRWRWHWDPRFLPSGSELERAVRAERVAAAAEGISVPTMLVRGANSDIVSEEALEHMQSLIPHAETVEVQATGHMIAGDDNDVFTSELKRFLGTLPPRS